MTVATGSLVMSASAFQDGSFALSGNGSSYIVPSSCQSLQSQASLPSVPSRSNADPVPVSPNSTTSPQGMFRVLGYYPSQGKAGSPVAVHINLAVQTSEALFLRLVIGCRAMTTAVHQLKLGTWELRATAPMDVLTSSVSTHLLAVQALDKTNEILDSVTFGTFTYIHSTSVKRENSEDQLDTRGHSVMRSASNSNASISVKPSRSPDPSSRSSRTLGSHLHQLKKKQLMKSKHPVWNDDASVSQRAALNLVTPVDGMTKDWDADELACGRRLVRFVCVRDGPTLTVSCARIALAEYVPGDAVISCIYRADTDSCCVTSVDIIFLLEHLVSEHFDIEEKNRIRRNLEGFRPKTVSKTRLESNDFFAQIMDFPPPKPRNIEKDLKVFDWSILPQALGKIISRLPRAPPILEKPDVSCPPKRASSASPSASSLETLMPDLLPSCAPDDCVSPESLMSSPYLHTPEFNDELFLDVMPNVSFSTACDQDPLSYLACPTPAVYNPYLVSGLADQEATYLPSFALDSQDGICPSLLSSAPSTLSDDAFNTSDTLMLGMSLDAPPGFATLLGQTHVRADSYL